MDNEIKQQHLQREGDLHLCLQYCSWVTQGVFTTGERIMINQERGSLCEAISNDSDNPRYVLDGELAMKVEKTIGNIRFSKWNPELLTKQYK